MAENMITALDTYEAFVQYLLENVLPKHVKAKDLQDTGRYGPLVESWTTGGATGGNCWGDGANQVIEAEPEPDDELTEKILTAVAPNVTFLQYRRLLRGGIYQYDDDTTYEYYGNYTHYRTRMLKLDVLYQELREMFK